MTFKLDILHAVTDTLKTITPADGYVYDLSDFDPGDGHYTARVYRGRGFFSDESDPLPMLSILEAVSGEDVVAQQASDTPTSAYWWPLVIQGWVLDDRENPTDPAYVLLRDVRKRLAIELKRRTADRSRFHFGLPENVIQGMRFSAGIVRPANEISAYAGFVLGLELEIVDRADAEY